MPIRRLELVGFRNYERWELEPAGDLTILVGPNAAGKTNAIEAVELVTSTVSFRRPRWEDVVGWDTDLARVTMYAETDGRPLEVSVEIGRDGKRAYRVNGSPKRRVSEVAGTLPSVTFSPDDLGMVKGSSEKRRTLVDELGEQLSQTYAQVRKDYGRVVRQRNALLKGGDAGQERFAPWDEQLVALGARLLVHRVRLLRRVAEHTVVLYGDLSDGEELTIGYADKAGLGEGEWSLDPDHEMVAEKMRSALQARKEDERTRQVTLVGPHRDDVVLRIGGRDARSFASQGQQRTVALAWKLAEVRVIEEVAGRKPVLLLDDVMSELDASRRHALMSRVRRDVQTVVTTTNTGYFEAEVLAAAKVVELAR